MGVISLQVMALLSGLAGVYTEVSFEIHSLHSSSSELQFMCNPDPT